MQPWQPLLEWWFGPSADKAVTDRQGLWFGKKPEQDAEARVRFGEWIEQALSGGVSDWEETPEGWLALILLLDQLPRMVHRDTPRAFAGDAQARELALQGLARGWDLRLPAAARVFVYLVLEHAEDPVLQNRAVALFQALHDQVAMAERAPFASFLDYARRHQVVVARFGRFPHRNSLLGRPSTAEEVTFLQEPGSGF
ncbi:MAG: DUF924 family protein [Pseudomonadota bacterium]